MQSFTVLHTAPRSNSKISKVSFYPEHVPFEITRVFTFRGCKITARFDVDFEIDRAKKQIISVHATLISGSIDCGNGDIEQEALMVATNTDGAVTSVDITSDNSDFQDALDTQEDNIVIEMNSDIATCW